MQKASDSTKAELCFRTAIEIAQRQSARSPELRAAIRLARLLAKQGRRDEAHAMMSEIYNLERVLSWMTSEGSPKAMSCK